MTYPLLRTIRGPSETASRLADHSRGPLFLSHGDWVCQHHQGKDRQDEETGNRHIDSIERYPEEIDGMCCVGCSPSLSGLRDLPFIYPGVSGIDGDCPELDPNQTIVNGCWDDIPGQLVVGRPKNNIF
jgi:hypothetical protein